MLHELKWNSDCLESLNETHSAIHCCWIRVFVSASGETKRRGREARIQQCGGIRHNRREEAIHALMKLKEQTTKAHVEAC